MKAYAYLMRLHRPIGIFLLLWPTLWALWLAGKGRPNVWIVCIFILGVIIMRSAGCIINDFFDRNVDRYVVRTKDRPLATGEIKPHAALILFFILLLMAFLLVLLLNKLTIQLAFVGALLAILYPLMKRFTHLPQLGLGFAFAWGIPMAFAAITHQVNIAAWVLFVAGVVWPIIYDTQYAMVDQTDDEKIGIKSTAILFGKHNRIIIGLMQVIFLSIMVICGNVFRLNFYYFISLAIAGLLFIYQQWLIRNQQADACFKAFLNNQWIGMVIFIGIVLSYPL